MSEAADQGQGDIWAPSYRGGCATAVCAGSGQAPSGLEYAYVSFYVRVPWLHILKLVEAGEL